MQDRVNLKWRDAMELLGRHFTNEERAAGWPESFKPERIAVLQRPYKLGDPSGKRLMQAFLQGLNEALTSGELTGTATTLTVTSKPPPVQRRNEFASEEWLSEFSRIGLLGVRNGKPQPYDVTAPTFASWLKSQSETPSEHIQNWFDAMAGAAVPDAPVAVLPDYRLLATSDKLLDAFRSYGLKSTWFKDLHGHQWLLDARRIKGQGQRSHTIPPMFCPYAVMKGLIGQVRRPIGTDTGWRILANKFPLVYAEFEAHDPREPNG